MVLCICYPLSWLVTDVALLIYYKKRSREGFASPGLKHI